MPLTMFKVGAKARVMRVTGVDEARRHLSALGFVPGIVVTIIQINDGNMIIGLHDGRIALNADTAKRVIAEPFE